MNYNLISTILFLTLSCTCKSTLFDSESCYSFGSGNVFPGGARKVDHKLQFTKAMSKFLWVPCCYNLNINCFIISLELFSVSKPAPEWEATAVVNGEITQLKLSSFKGKYLVFFFYPLDLWVNYILHLFSKNITTFTGH